MLQSLKLTRFSMNAAISVPNMRRHQSSVKALTLEI